MGYTLTILLPCLVLALVVARPVLYWLLPFYDGNTHYLINQVLDPCRVLVIHGPMVKALKSSSMDVLLPNSGASNGVRCIRFGLAGLLKCPFELYPHGTFLAASADDDSVLTTPTHAVQFFRNSHRHTKAVNNDSGWLFGEVLGVCVGLLSGSDWKRVRQQVEDGFARPAATRYTADLVTLAREYLQTTLAASSDQSLETKGIIQVEPAKTLQFYPFLSVAQILFGRLSPMQRSQLTTLAPLREELFKEVIRGGINRLSIAPWFRSRGVRILNEFQTQWEQFVEDAYHAAVKRNQSPRPLVIGLWESYQAGTISKRECLQTLDESLYANLDVTTHALSWNVLLLAENIEAQRELRQEVLSALENEASESYERYIDRDDTFLAACVLESARLRPILPFSNPESAPEDLYVDGYLIPANTNVIVDAQAINIDNPFWVNGTQYNPRRFFTLNKSDVRHNMWRFGFGPRQCLGKHIGERMLKAIVAEIVRQYVVSISADSASAKNLMQEDSWVGLPATRIQCVPVGRE
ncbi:cytochrome P450 CYP12A2 [Aspergillus udagawae]|uniref:Cytochrome P450 CYP12A2 n=1 Tax=Aspergillus udagawae TaxID=91492 RepID=A0A8H3S9S5_9EURO|nr:cytochrome P450 CYP12A2 [Aspergillus udagawae]